MKELRIEFGEFGKGIDPREHICRRCYWDVACKLREALDSKNVLVGTRFNTAIIKECFLFQEEKEE